MSVEESKVLQNILRALANDRDVEGEIDWKYFSAFCDEHQITADFAKTIWKQLGGENCCDGDDDEKSTVFLKHAFISNYCNRTDFEDLTDNKYNDEYEAHETDEHNDAQHAAAAAASDSNELILEFEISDEIIENNDNSPHQQPLSAAYHPLKSQHNRLQDISTLFTKYDTYNNGTLIHSEFISMIIELYPAADRNIISDLFTLLDTNDDGTFDYSHQNYMLLFQNQLNSYPKNMLSFYEFRNELKSIYCCAIHKDNSFDSNSTEYDEDAISTAYSLKKELDYALSLRSNEASNVLLSKLWNWIQTHGISSVHDSVTLHKQMRDISVRNKLLQQEMIEYQDNIREMKYTLSVSERDRENLSLSLDSLQFELQQMAMNLSQEQNLSDTNSQEIDKLRTSLQRSQNTIKSLQCVQSKIQANETHNVWIESGNRIYPQPIDDLEDATIEDSDSCNEHMHISSASRFHRDHSYDLPNEEVATSMNEEDAMFSNKKKHNRKQTIVVTEPAALEALNVSLNTNETTTTVSVQETVQSMDDIQNSLETQKEKLNAIMDLVKRLDLWRDSMRTQNITITKERYENKNDLTKFRKVLPLLVMGIVCFSGYKIYKYRTRRVI